MVTIFDDILPQKTNLSLLNQCVQLKWGFAWDNKENTDKILNFLFQNKNFGFFIKTLENNQPVVDTSLNNAAKIITDIVTDKMGWKNELWIKRFYWNMYFPGAYTETHTDMNIPGYISILYNLHTTDGGTEINKKFYPDQMGQAKIFDSATLHKGLAPVKTPIRFNLNIIIEKPNGSFEQT